MQSELHLFNNPCVGFSDREVQRELNFVRSSTVGLHAIEHAGQPGDLRGVYPPQNPLWLNTDGIDPSGSDVHVHHCAIVNDDDSIAVKPMHGGSSVNGIECSQNMLFEHLVLTGVGASIGSVPPHTGHNCVRNITFRNITMPGTTKGIYIKSNPSCGLDDGQSKTAEITNILYEDFQILHPSWWAIWIGPQQQHEPKTALGQKCALDWPISPSCPTQVCFVRSRLAIDVILSSIV